MPALRQAIRWATAGWWLFGMFYVFAVIRMVTLRTVVAFVEVLRPQELPQIIALPVGGEVLTSAITLLLLFGALAVPAGFVVYQIRSWLHWKVLSLPFVPGVIVPMDSGQEVLRPISGLADALQEELGLALRPTPDTEAWLWRPFRHRTLNHLAPSVRLIQRDQAPKRNPTPRRLAFNYQQNWQLGLFVWHWAINHLPDHEYLASEVSHLLDIHHALESARIAVILAYIVFLAHDLVFYGLPSASIVFWAWILVSLPLTLITFALLVQWIAAQWRRNSYRVIHLMRGVIQIQWSAKGTFLAPAKQVPMAHHDAAG
jgi:hypothetical protein